jgi:pSer/pThr/pTyr-binding forkhead associated (FHA) protein
MPRIVLRSAAEDASVLELTGDRPVTIGRAKSSGLVLDDPSVSRLHAIVRATIDGQWQIVDRESANGISVNGVRTKEAVLHGGDKILIGIYKLRYEDSTGRQVASYGTTDLPKRFEPATQKSGYSGSAVVVTSVGNVGDGASSAGRAQTKEHEKQLMALLGRVKDGLNEMKSPEGLTQRVLDFALEIEGAERGFVMLLDEESAEHGDFAKGNYNFLPAKIQYRKRTSGARTGAAPQLAISRSIIHKVMQAGLPMLVSDGQTDVRFSASQSIAKAGIQSAMCAPLGIGNRIRGLIYVDNLSCKGMFTVEDLNAFTVIAVQAGLAIDRLRGRSETAEKVQR